MGAQGDQVAPRAPKLKANDAQKSPKSRPKSSQDAKSGPKSFQNETKSAPKLTKIRKQNGARIQNEFGEHI